MAEFAAKVRARFKRRHSGHHGGSSSSSHSPSHTHGGLPSMGIPSLLSRSSARSSSGSHGSSGSATTTTTTTTTTNNLNSPPAVDADVHHPMQPTQQHEHHHQQLPHHPDRDRVTHRDAPADDGGLAASAAAAVADDQHDQGARIAQDHDPASLGHINSGGTRPPRPLSLLGSSSGLSASLAPADQPGQPSEDDINDTKNHHTAVGAGTDLAPAAAAATATANAAAAALTTTTGPAPPEATEAGPASSAPTHPGIDSDSEMAAYSARTSQHLASIHEQQLLGLADADADADAASIISAPSAANLDLHLQHHHHHHSSPQARYKHHLSHLHNSQLNPNHKLPPSPAPASPSRKHRDAHPQRPPRTPKLSGGRPLHIALPPASFGPPSNLSPTSIYSASASVAPSSPLGRYSSTLSAAAAATAPNLAAPTSAASALAPMLRPQAPIRRQSLLSNRQSTLIQTLLRDSAHPDDAAAASSPSYNSNNNNNNIINHHSLNPDHLLSISANMVTRKIWVKRPGGSATLVTIHEDDVVDDVRDMILRKYANSLGRTFDAPDLTLRIRHSGNQQERLLSPEEHMARTLDAFFPTGQTIDDALIIDVPLRRTPRASPRAGPPHAPHMQYYVDDARPQETANDYFGPGAISALPVTVTAPSTGSSHPHAISVLSTGQVPQIPSPGGGGARARTYRERPDRPRLGRQHTSSPTLINMSSGAAHQGSIVAAATAAPHEHSSQVIGGPQPAPLSTPPGPTSNIGIDGGPGGVPGIGVGGGGPGVGGIPQRAATPPPRVSSPRPAAPKRKKKTDHPSLPKGMLNGSVPPINVLIVEDNIINLKLLEAFVKRLKVRWSTAMNGRDAVTKWRNGGFHLVLMDIQLPVMSGLDATREIRRLERVNSIGVFSSAASTAPEEVRGEPDEKDKLVNMDLFKSPVIIVALTASSLQSDRHEALAAGCNDFLTKPVNFVWLERKVMEWGCMQALIDFDGWRKWKDFAQQASSNAADEKAKLAVAKTTKSKKPRSGLAQTVSATA